MEKILEFVYTDAKGKKSTRKVDHVKRISSPDNQYHYLRGYDLTVMGVRTFREDRIQYIDDASPEWLATLVAEQIQAKQKQDSKMEIHFTGFPRKDVKPYLEEIANITGLFVRKSVTYNLGMLVIGYNASKLKMAKAQSQGAYILSEGEYLDFVQTGEIPKDTVQVPSVADPSLQEDQGILLKNPIQYFQYWKYNIKKAQWSALGINSTWSIDSKKTKKLRGDWDVDNPRYQELHRYFKNKIKTTRTFLKKGKYGKKYEEIKENSNLKEQSEARKILNQKVSTELYIIMKGEPGYQDYLKLKESRANKKIHYHTYAYQSPLAYDFHEGDLFQHRVMDKQRLQIVSIDENIEAQYHCANRIIGYHLTPAQLALWLETDVPVSDICKIEKNQSRSEIAKLYEYTE